MSDKKCNHNFVEVNYSVGGLANCADFCTECGSTMHEVELKEKLAKAIETLEFYAEIQDANDELTLEDSERLYMKDYEDFEYVDWSHKDIPGKSYKVKTLGRLARQTLKKLRGDK